jgi:hypothetical protein
MPSQLDGDAFDAERKRLEDLLGGEESEHETTLESSSS